MRLPAALVVAALVVSPACSPGDPAATAPTATVSQPGDVVVVVGNGSVAVEVASTPEGRALGLMFRAELEADAGMLFVFPEPQTGGFWMKNTLIPLSIAFIASTPAGTYEVVEIMDMEPCSADPCPSYDPGVSYDLALEVNWGWFEQHGVGEGAGVRVEGDLPQAS